MAENNSSAPLNAFEKWYSDYHNDACDNHGGIDCTNPKGIAEDAWEACAAFLAPQAVAAQAAPAAVAVSATKLASLVEELRMIAAVQEPEYPNFQIIIEEAAKALESATPALPATEDSSAGDLAEGATFDAAFTNRVIDALQENGDPVSVDAAEEMAKLRDLLLAAPQAQPADALDALTEIVGCIEAANSEGLDEALVNNTDARLTDLVQRRLLPAFYTAIAAQTRAAMAAAQEGGNAAKEA